MADHDDPATADTATADTATADTATADTATADTATAGTDERASHWIEICAALLLGIAGLLTAYSAYNAALAGGDALKGYTQSSRTTADANGYYNEGSQAYNADQALFLEYQLLVEEGQVDTADVIKDNLFSDMLFAATEAWLAIPEGEGPPTPLDMPEYQPEEWTLGDDLYDQADTEFATAQQIDDQGDNFDLASVYLAVSLFLAGIAALFKVRRVQLSLLTFAALLLVPGILAIAKGKGWGWGWS